MQSTGKFPLADIVLALTMLCFGLAVFVASFDLPEPALEPIGPAAFPTAGSLILMALAAIVLARAFIGAVRGRNTEHRKRGDLALVMLGITIVYFFVMQMDWLNFQAGTVLYIFVVTAALTRWRIKTLPIAVVIALVLGVGLNLTFTELLYIDLP